jgi:hypothetical protein
LRRAGKFPRRRAGKIPRRRAGKISADRTAMLIPIEFVFQRTASGADAPLVGYLVSDRCVDLIHLE